MGLWRRLSTLHIKKGHKQRCTSDVYSFGKMLETAVRNKSFVSLSSLALRTSVGEIFTQLANVAQKLISLLCTLSIRIAGNLYVHFTQNFHVS